MIREGPLLVLEIIECFQLILAFCPQLQPFHQATAVLLLATACEAGPFAYGACQTACNAGAGLCYTQAGLVFGTVATAAAATGPVGWVAFFTGAGGSVVASAAACSAAQGVCMAACTPLLIAPTP
jgi:hypothetical protein